MEEQVTFDKFGLDINILKAIGELKWHNPTPIQEMVIPYAMEGKDILIRAKTGSGKTGAFVIPTLQKLINIKKEVETHEVRCIMIAPSKELCKQICRNIKYLLKFCPRLKCVDISQSNDITSQKSILMEKPDIIVSTPKRIVEHLKAKNLKIDQSLSVLVIDEADLALKFGCKTDIFDLFNFTPKLFQTIMASATIDNEVAYLKKHILNNPMFIQLDDSDLPETSQLSQYYMYAEEEDKFVLLYSFFKFTLIPGKTLIFVNSVEKAYKVGLFLEQIGINRCILNSELPLASRCHILDQFNEGRYNIIIASDENLLSDQSSKTSKKKRKKDTEFIVSRGIDFQYIVNVINFDFPSDVRSYVHRVGRTARGMNQGNSISLVNIKEQPIFEQVQEFFSLDKNGEKQSIIKKYVVRMDQLESVRYRIRDIYRSITRVAISEARKKEIKQELLNSKKLSSYFEDNPSDLKFLKHDKALHIVKQQAHLKNVPEYIVPKALQHFVKKPQLSKQKRPASGYSILPQSRTIKKNKKKKDRIRK